MASILIKGGTLLPMTADVTAVKGDLLVKDGRIAGVGETGSTADLVIDAHDCAVLPGFVQTHIHLCQTIFRGSADDLALIDWLRKRVWPMEAAHTPDSIKASAQLGIAELIKGGTTCALTMETVNHTAEVFKVVEQTGFRATVGKCMMDKGDEVPAALQEQTETSVAESLDLLNKWHNKAEGRIRYCFAPRFAVSCTSQLLKDVARLAREKKVLVHTHASENRTECQIVEDESGLRNINYLDSLGLTGAHVVLAHCVHLNAAEMDLLSSTNTRVSHCPSSNLKLGSGIAPVVDLLQKGVSVTLGADGAACNNRLDMFTEMRTAALLQKVTHGPEALNAETVLRMATIGGARALGLDNEIGSLEIGKRADVALVRLAKLHTAPTGTDVVSSLVYSAEAADVETVLIDGKVVMRERELMTMKESEVVADANREACDLFTRAGIN
jgi:5-methylthioadenosine/S-adenosylhomocysteine deaminase